LQEENDQEESLKEIDLIEISKSWLIFANCKQSTKRGLSREIPDAPAEQPLDDQVDGLWEVSGALLKLDNQEFTGGNDRKRTILLPRVDAQ
jgi:hypothetical protein